MYPDQKGNLFYVTMSQVRCDEGGGVKTAFSYKELVCPRFGINNYREHCDRLPEMTYAFCWLFSCYAERRKAQQLFLRPHSPAIPCDRLTVERFDLTHRLFLVHQEETHVFVASIRDLACFERRPES